MFRILDIENRHAVDRRAGRRIGGGVHDVVRADDDRDIGILESFVDVLHLVEFIVRDVDLGEEHVHVTRHTPGDGVDGELHVLAFRLEFRHQLFDNRLRLRQSHAVTGHDNDALGIAQPASARFLGRHFSGLLNLGLCHFNDWSLRLLCRFSARNGSLAEQDIEKLAIHGTAHNLRKQETRRSDDTADSDEERIADRHAGD